MDHERKSAMPKLYTRIVTHMDTVLSITCTFSVCLIIHTIRQ